MNCTQITFSPTGGTKRIADILTEQLGECPATIDLANSNTDFSGCSVPSDNIAVIAVPSYGGRVPQTAAARLSAIKGNHAKAVIVCVYGNRAYEDTLAELQDIAEGCGRIYYYRRWIWSWRGNVPERGESHGNGGHGLREHSFLLL